MTNTTLPVPDTYPTPMAEEWDEILEGYNALNAELDELSEADEPEYKVRVRQLCRTDLFWFLIHVLRCDRVEHPWIYARIKEIEADTYSNEPTIYLFGRGHLKSTILTFGATLQEIIRNPEITILIMSYSNVLASAFLRQLKQEMESNTLLHYLFPEIFYEQPKTESPRWSVQQGLVVKRQGNPKESTIECSGLVDGQPTSRHYDLRVMDDVVVKESVFTPEQIKKTNEAMQMSHNLGKQGGRLRVIGTVYDYNDSYMTMIREGIVKARVHPATDDGTPMGRAVFMDQDELDEHRKNQGLDVFTTQMLLDPRGSSARTFLREWIEYYDGAPNPVGQNIYIVCDPASSKSKGSDFTAFLVIGLGPDGNYRLIDGVRDHLELNDRWNALLNLVRKWKPVCVGYEEYGAMADRQHFQLEGNRINYAIRLRPLGGKIAKADRIKALAPLFEQGKIWFPHTMRRTLLDGTTVDLVEQIVEEELMRFPASTHDDAIDAFARILDPKLGAKFPASGLQGPHGGAPGSRYGGGGFERPKFSNVGYAHMKRGDGRGAGRSRSRR